MSTTLPLTVTPEAADFIAELNLQEPFQTLLDNIPLRIPNVHAVSVFLNPPYDTDTEPRVILDIDRDITVGFELTEEWDRWAIGALPTEQLAHFCLLSNYRHKNGRPAVS